MKTVLVAASPAAADVIVGALDGVANTITAHALEAATGIIEHGVDLVVASIYFDGTRMFDLLRRVRARPEPIPVLCVRAVSAPSLIGAVTSQPVFSSFEVVDRASRALGALGFVDLVQRQAAIGAAVAN